MKQANNKQTGVTLIEVMVSVAVLVIGVVGMAALQARTLVVGQSSFYRSIAADLATNLAERIRANKSPFMASTDSLSQPASPPDFSKCTVSNATVTCSAQDTGHESYRVLEDMQEWYSSLSGQLPNGSYTLTATAASGTGPAASHYRYTLTISWLDSRADNSNSSYAVVIE